MKKTDSNPILYIIKDGSSFKLLRMIAEGGMGAVYQALQAGSDGFEKTVAIKMMLPKLTHKRFADLFVLEAKLVANLVHENIVQIYQLGRTEVGYYIVMEYVNGVSLANFISYHNVVKQRVPQELAVFITSRICRGLAYAHKRTDPLGTPLEIVHRDVCPNNILITTEGLPKLADFGVAKMAKSMLLGDKYLVGKLLYMAPEQALKKPVDFRADIFSLGATLFELLSFRSIRTLDPDNPKDGSLIAAQPIPWGLLGVLPDGLMKILHKMLALRPEDRYPDTDTLAHDLEYFIYKDGYGPTIQTLEKYMRDRFPYLYSFTEPNPYIPMTDMSTIGVTQILHGVTTHKTKQ